MIDETREFKKQGAGDHPLANCVQWAREHQVQDEDGAEAASVTPMFVVCELVPNANGGAWRRYFAATRDALYALVTSRRCAAQRHFDEVVTDGPCKFYLDLEVKLDRFAEFGCSSAAELHQRAMREMENIVRDAKEFHNERGQRDAEAVLLEAHKASKFSVHVVFNKSLWTSRVHCGEFARQLGESDSALRCALIDQSVYSHNHAVRTLGSTKPDEPERPFVRAGQALDEPLDREQFFASLITHVTLSAPESELGEEVAQVHVSSLFLDDYADFLETVNAEPIVLPPRTSIFEGARAVERRGGNVAQRTTGAAERLPEMASLIGVLQELFRARQPYQFSLVASLPGRLVVQCNSRMCVIRGAEHSSNRVKVQVDLLSRTWRPACHNADCQLRPAQWRALPDEACVAARRFCEAFYGREWRGAQVCTALAPLVRRAARGRGVPI